MLGVFLGSRYGVSKLLNIGGLRFVPRNPLNRCCAYTVIGIHTGGATVFWERLDKLRESHKHAIRNDAGKVCLVQAARSSTIPCLSEKSR